MSAERREPSLPVLVAIAAVGPMALNMYVPSMPGIAADFGVDYALIQTSLSVYLLTIALAPLGHGPAADRFGRRPVVFVGIALFVLGCLICAAAGSLAMLIVGRIVQAVGACSGIVVARAMVIDVWGPERAGAKLSYVIAAMAVMPSLATPLGGYLDEYASWRWSFLALALVSLPVAVFAWFSLPETRDRAQRRTVLPGGLFGAYRALLATPSFLAYVLQSAGGLCGFYVFLAGAPYVLDTLLGLGPSVYGRWFILAAVLHIIGNWVAGRYTMAVGRDLMIFIGNALALVAALAQVAAFAAGALSVELIFGLMGVMALGNGLSIPNGSSAAIGARPDIAGAGSGLSSFIQLTLAAAATLLTGKLLDGATDAMPMAVLMLLFALLASVAHLAVWNPLRKTAA